MYTPRMCPQDGIGGVISKVGMARYTCLDQADQWTVEFASVRSHYHIPTAIWQFYTAVMVFDRQYILILRQHFVNISGYTVYYTC